MLIPTKLKFKIPQTLRYPIGAESISEALSGVPQFENLSIMFYDKHFLFASEFKEARKQNEPYPIFEVKMECILPGLSSGDQHYEQGFYDENWEILVYPVPRELRSTTKQLLLSEALPKAREWCQKPRTETWKTGKKHFQVFFDEVESTIMIEQD